MTTSAVAPLRYILTPTVKEEYDSDQSGYDAAAVEPTMAKLSLENDKVSGLEHVYGHILNYRDRPILDLSAVEGTEGFFSVIKQAATGMIETIKNFFKWIWSFFGSKSAAAAVKTKNLKKHAAEHGVKDGEIPYPANVSNIYDKPGKVDGNLNWLPGVVDAIESNIDKVEKYGKLVETFCTKIKTSLTGKGAYEPIRKEFVDGTQELFKPDAQGFFNFGRTHNMRMNKEGQMAWQGATTDRQRFKGATFQVAITQFNSLVDKVAAAHEKLLKLTTDLTKLEDPMVKSLEAALHGVQGQGNNTQEERMIKYGVDEIKRVARVAMQNISNLETELYRSYLASVDLLHVSVKG